MLQPAGYKRKAGVLDFPQLYDRNPPSQFITGPNRFECLPDELVLGVFGYLDVEALMEVCCVCRRWRNLSEENVLWKPILQRLCNEFVVWEQKNPNPSSWKAVYVRKIIAPAKRTERRKVVLNRRLFAPFSLTTGHQRELFRRLIAEGTNRMEKGWSASKVTYEDFNFKRDNEHLIDIVEEAQASGKYKDLLVIRIPMTMRWRVRSNEGLDWVEEKHETFKKMLPVEPRSFELWPGRGPADAQALVVCDVSPAPGLQLSDAALAMLLELTGKHSPDDLLSIPRHHPALLQTLRALGPAAGSSLRLVKIPANIEFFVASVANREYVSEAYRIWPADLQYSKVRIAFGDLVGNKLTALHLSVEAWNRASSSAGVSPAGEAAPASGEFAGDQFDSDSDEDGAPNAALHVPHRDGKAGDFFSELTQVLESNWRRE